MAEAQGRLVHIHSLKFESGAAGSASATLDFIKRPTLAEPVAPELKFLMQLERLPRATARLIEGVQES